MLNLPSYHPHSLAPEDLAFIQVSWGVKELEEALWPPLISSQSLHPVASVGTQTDFRCMCMHLGGGGGGPAPAKAPYFPGYGTMFEPRMPGPGAPGAGAGPGPMMGVQFQAGSGSSNGQQAPPPPQPQGSYSFWGRPVRKCCLVTLP